MTVIPPFVGIERFPFPVRPAKIRRWMIRRAWAQR
jgi:hypothetical protein